MATRIARVNMELKQYDAALKALEGVSNPGYKARVAELKGDIYLAQGNVDKARVEYQTAADVEGAESNNILKMKIDDLAFSTQSES